MNNLVKYTHDKGYGRFTFPTIFRDNAHWTRSKDPKVVPDGSILWYSIIVNDFYDLSDDELKLILNEFMELTDRQENLKKFFKPLFDNI